MGIMFLLHFTFSSAIYHIAAPYRHKLLILRTIYSMADTAKRRKCTMVSARRGRESAMRGEATI